MKKTLVLIAAGVLLASGAFAAQLGPVSVSGDVGAMSDYTYRGISQSDEGPSATAAVNFGLGNLTLGGAAYSVDKAVGKDHAELDAVVNYRIPLSEMMSLDVGAIRYNYPGSSNFNTNEGNLGVNFLLGKATAQVRTSYSNNYFGTGSRSFYTEANGTYELPWWGLSAVGHVGTLDLRDFSHNIVDTKLGLDKTIAKNLVIEAAWVDNNAGADFLGSATNLAGNRAVVSAIYNF